MLILRRIKTILDVVRWGLCVGCGVCRYACKKGAVSLVNLNSIGIRPHFESNICKDCVECLSCCPGYRLNASLNSNHSEGLREHTLIGPTFEIWEGHAKDEQLRYAASSGGVLSALALYCLERESMGFVLHTGMDPQKPWLNSTAQSRNRAELLSRAGSRYGPSSPCEALERIENSDRPCVFIGKPCDTAAVTMARQKHPELDRKLGLVLTFFCAGPPGSKATLELLRKSAINPEEVEELHYRGMGWPGHFRVRKKKGSEDAILTYEESWGYLAKYPRSFRCHLCPDGLGEFADISCGDAWHRYENDGNPGLSLVLVRSERGKELLHRAMAAGYVQMTPSGPDQVIKAQGMVQRRKEVVGRLMAMRMFFIPNPKFDGFNLLQLWSTNTWRVKARTILGTLRRLWRRGMWHRNPLFNNANTPLSLQGGEEG